MPSLSALGQFKYSFNNIANEKEDIESLSLPFDDLKLPTTEAPPFNFSRHDTSSINVPDSDDSDDFDVNAFLDGLPGDESPPPMDLPSMDMPSGGAMSALDDFLKDLTPGSSGEDGFSTPDGLLSGLADEINAAPSDFESSDIGSADLPTDDLSTEDFPMEDFPAEEFPTEDFPADDLSADTFGSADFPADDFPADDFGSADLPADDFPADDFGSADLPTDDFPTGDFPAADDDDEDFGAIDMGGESPHFEASASEEPAAADDFSFENDTFDMGQDSLPETQAESDDAFASEGAIEDEDTSEGFSDTDGGIDLGGESPDFELGDTGGDFSLDGLSGMDTAGTDTGGMDAGIDDSGFDSGFETPLPDTDFGADFSDTDTSAVHEFGDLGSDFASDSIELGGESSAETELHDHDSGYSSTSFGDDDFSLSGLDDILNKTKIDLPKPQPKKGFFGRKKEKAAELPDAEDDVEEISLTQEEVDSLLRTLSLYPLNLRIICEELIAEQVILPQQLSKLIRLLVNGASVKETAAHAEQIIGKPIIIPRSFEKGTGAAFEAEQSSFAYIFIHNFLPVLKLFAFIAILGASVIYLGYRFVYTPIKAESLYKRGYERIPAGEYQRANELFHDAFTLHRKKKWFYLYAEAFRDQRRYMLAEGKYDELLRYYPRDKKGVLDYANLNTYYMMNYDKANRLLQRELLDYAPNDFHGLLAAGDNFLAWADSDPTRFYDRYEDARFCYARLLERNGWQVPIVERMMKYFIRTDNLREVLHLRVWFENSNKRKLSPESLSELGGYLLDKQLERPSGVPNPYVESIESVRAMLLQAVTEDPYLPESHYHLARYHHNLGNMYEERLTLENAIRAFDLVKQESVRRRLYRVDTHYRYANLLVNSREFFPAEEQVVKGIELYEDFLSRNLILATPQLGQLYSLQGDLEYFVKSGNMEAALRSYHVAERYGYSPPEVQYRMGAAYYQREDWRNALEYLFRASAELPLNRRLLFALGNAAYQRGDYFAAHGYYNRLLDILEVQRIRLPVLLPNDSVQFLEVGERLMMARNNAGVINEALAAQTGNREYRSRAMAMYAESARAWDTITRHPETMTRMRLTDSPGAPSINLGYLNANNALRPNSGYNPQIFVRIDRDVLEPSRWEELVQY